MEDFMIDYSKIPHEVMTGDFYYTNVPKKFEHDLKNGDITTLMFLCLEWIWSHAGYKNAMTQMTSASRIRNEMFPDRRPQPPSVRTVERALRCCHDCGYISLPSNYENDESYVVRANNFVVFVRGQDGEEDQRLLLYPKPTLSRRKMKKGNVKEPLFDVGSQMPGPKPPSAPEGQSPVKGLSDQVREVGQPCDRVGTEVGQTPDGPCVGDDKTSNQNTSRGCGEADKAASHLATEECRTSVAPVSEECRRGVAPTVDNTTGSSTCVTGPEQVHAGEAGKASKAGKEQEQQLQPPAAGVAVAASLNAISFRPGQEHPERDGQVVDLDFQPKKRSWAAIVAKEFHTIISRLGHKAKFDASWEQKFSKYLLLYPDTPSSDGLTHFNLLDLIEWAVVKDPDGHYRENLLKSFAPASYIGSQLAHIQVRKAACEAKLPTLDQALETLLTCHKTFIRSGMSLQFLNTREFGPCWCAVRPEGGDGVDLDEWSEGVVKPVPRSIVMGLDLPIPEDLVEGESLDDFPVDDDEVLPNNTTPPALPRGNAVENIMVPDEPSLGSTERIDTYQKEFQRKVSMGNIKGEPTRPLTTEQKEKQMTDSEFDEVGISQAKAESEFLSNRIVQAVLKDGVPRWLNNDLVVRFEGLRQDGLFLQKTRPANITVIYADNILDRQSGKDPEDVGPQYSTSAYIPWINANTDVIRFQQGWNESDLTDDEIAILRSEAWTEAGLASDYDIQVAFSFIKTILGDDADVDKLERKVGKKVKVLEKQIFPDVFARAVKSRENSDDLFESLLPVKPEVY
jgi:hypothetical protein